MTTQPGDQPAQPGDQPATGPRHGLRLFLIWLVLALAADLVIWFVWKPHLPPGDMSDAARHQQFDIAVLAISGAPVVIFVLLYFIYSIVVWRARPGDDTDGEPIYGNTKIQATWIIGTTVIVLWLFVFGTVELVVPAGAGAGEGPSPIWKLAGTTSSTWTPNTNTTLQVQVIGQQWTWTYRYPQFGGMESSELMLAGEYPGDVPRDVAGRDPQLLGLPARREGRREPAGGQRGVRDAEGARQRHGPVQRAVRHLARRHVQLRPRGAPDRVPVLGERGAGQGEGDGVLAALPPYALTYDPTVVPQLGKNLPKIDGITGAAGYYYPPSDPVTP